MALTATATAECQQDIKKLLKLAKDCRRVEGSSQIPRAPHPPPHTHTHTHTHRTHTAHTSRTSPTPHTAQPDTAPRAPPRAPHTPRAPSPLAPLAGASRAASTGPTCTTASSGCAWTRRATSSSSTCSSGQWAPRGWSAASHATPPHSRALPRPQPRATAPQPLLPPLAGLLPLAQRVRGHLRAAVQGWHPRRLLPRGALTLILTPTLTLTLTPTLTPTPTPTPTLTPQAATTRGSPHRSGEMRSRRG